MTVRRNVKSDFYARILQYSFFGMQILAYISTFFNGHSRWFKAIEIFLIWFVCWIVSSFLNRKYNHFIWVFKIINVFAMVAIVYIDCFLPLYLLTKMVFMFLFSWHLDQIDNLENLRKKFKQGEK